ncbi:MAG: threonine synthase [Alphaproteobacteria bacterium]|nr:threonine synthase [Alphaproteobacteria bacterium]
MKYVSTRGQAPVLSFDDVLLAGLARDGGLYVPETWPEFEPEEIRAFRDLDYPALAVQVMLPFVGAAVTEDELAEIVATAYAGFGHKAVAPLKQLGRNEWLMELFHGPTLAFKDYAMQFLGRMFDHVLGQRGQRVTVVGATSGDTGSAAIEAFRDREAVDVFILHPKDRVSDVQRRQMTTVLSANVHNIAVEGSFDDCQDIVKGMFNDPAFRDDMGLAAVNSINWARIMSQVVYYFWAGVALGAPDRPIAFAVPTGNFGNVFAGYTARRMGLPVDGFVVGSNRNDILTRFFESGEMTTRAVVPTLSPSMDIQISSNFERLLFDIHGADGAEVARLMSDFRRDGTFSIAPGLLQETRELFRGFSSDDEETKRMIAQVYAETGEILDPHSAVGVAAARAGWAEPDVPMVILATAHPAKFPAAVEEATGIRPGLPASLAGLFQRRERCDVLPNDLAAVKAHVRARSRWRN